MIRGPDGPAAATELAGIRRRLISLIYETLILAAVLLASALPAVMLTRGWDHQHARIALQAWLIFVCACFYVWQWAGTGQTLPMKTWRMCLVAEDGSEVTAGRALARFCAAVFSVAIMGLGFVWALADRDRQFLHDRLAGTKLVTVPR